MAEFEIFIVTRLIPDNARGISKEQEWLENQKLNPQKAIPPLVKTPPTETNAVNERPKNSPKVIVYAEKANPEIPTGSFIKEFPRTGRLTADVRRLINDVSNNAVGAQDKLQKKVKALHKNLVKHYLDKDLIGRVGTVQDLRILIASHQTLNVRIYDLIHQMHSLAKKKDKEGSFQLLDELEEVVRTKLHVLTPSARLAEFEWVEKQPPAKAKDKFPQELASGSRPGGSTSHEVRSIFITCQKLFVSN